MPLIYKLLVIHVTIIVGVMAVVWGAIDTLAAGYFVTLMKKYHISPEPAHAMFIGAVHRYLVWACLGAIGLAVLLSYFMMRRVLKPLFRMTQISREIAAGNFSQRVPANTGDEVGQLARAFNHMARSLKEIEGLRRSLMIDVAHELRTPLTNMRGYLEALNDEVLPPSAETFALLQDETMRLVLLVEDVLRLARADAAHKTLTPEAVDLRQLLDGALVPFQPILSQRRIKVALRTPTDLPQVRLDCQRMTRVLRNLIDNAARYATPGGTFEIQVNVNHNELLMTFCNPADGLSGDDLPYLFERFFRGEKSRSRAHGGAGIGLAIVKELVTAHGGEVSAELVDGMLTIRLSFPLRIS